MAKATQAPAKVRPLVDTVAVTDFGGIEDLAEFRTHAEHDYTYVPGWSELRRTQDLEKSEVVRGERKRQDVSPLPVNVRWVRSEGSYKKLGSSMNNGYRAVTKDDLAAKNPWLTALPPGAQISATGEIKTAAGDATLMVATAQAAARNALRKQHAASAMTNAVEGELVKVGDSVKGANPTITATAHVG